MRIDIATSDDLVGMYGRYTELVLSGYEGELELAFAPGVYGVASIGPISLDLGGNPAPRDPKIDVVLRGSQGTGGTVFRDLGVLVNARSLVVEDIIATGRHQTLLEARVATRFEMRRCTIAGNSYDPPFGNGALVKVMGTFEQAAYSASIEDVWLVRNDQQSDAAIIALGPATGSYIHAVSLRRVTSIENGTSADIGVIEAKSIEVDDCVAVKDRGSWLRHARSGAISITGGAFVVADPGGVIASVLDALTPPRSFDIEVSAEVHATTAATELPRGVRVSGGVRDGSGIRRDAAAIDQLAAELAEAPPPADARKRLRAALAGMR